MLDDLKIIASRVMKSLSWKKPPDPPRDPYADRLVPVRRGPPDRSDAVALLEPDDE